MSDDSLYLAIKAKVKGCTKSILGDQPDWAANMEIVDLLNTKPSYAEHVARVLEKRIRHWNPVVGTLSLTLAETIMKNCPCFHPYAAHPDFIDSMLRELHRKKPKKTLLQKVKVQTPVVSEISKLQRRDKILLLIESWGKAFKESSQYPIFYATYEDLLRQNFRFPHPMKDEVSPVFTPAAKPMVLPDTDTTGPIKDYTLQNALANVELFMDTLNETNEDEDLRGNDVVQTLLQSLTQTQEEIMNRINANPSEELLNELLKSNDEICQAMNFYNGVLTGAQKRRKADQPRRKHKRHSEEDGSEDEESDEESEAASSRSPSPKHGAATEDLLGKGFALAAPQSAVLESQSYDTASASDTEDESEEDTETEDEEEEEASLAEATKILALAPPPSSGKGKSRRGDQGQKTSQSKELVVADPWTMATTGGSDDPFASFEATDAPKQIKAADDGDEFMAIALRGAENQQVVPAKQPHQANIFDPL